MFQKMYVPRVLCFQDPMFQVSYVPRVLCSKGFVFPGSYVSNILCSNSSVFPGLYLLYVPMFPGSYVLGVLCFILFVQYFVHALFIHLIQCMFDRRSSVKKWRSEEVTCTHSNHRRRGWNTLQTKGTSSCLSGLGVLKLPPCFKSTQIYFIVKLTFYNMGPLNHFAEPQ